MALFLKNTTAVNQTWDGLLVLPGEYRLINKKNRLGLSTNNILLKAISDGDALVATENDGTGDVISVTFALNILREDAPERDEEGARVVKIKVAPSKWEYQTLWFETTTSQLNGVFAKMINGNDIPGIIYRCFDNAGVQIIAQADANANCVESRFEVELPFDFRLTCMSVRVGGTPDATKNLRLWIRLIPDVTVPNGGRIIYANGINLRFFNTNEMVIMKRGSPKLMVHDAVTHTNKIEFRYKHAAGLKQKVIFNIEFYRI